jgi:hypothetical protein
VSLQLYACNKQCFYGRVLQLFFSYNLWYL